MRLALTICIVIFLLCPIFSFAEFYRYVDENGVVSYTDDLSKISRQKRDRAKRMTDVTPSEPEKPAAANAPLPAQAPEQDLNQGYEEMRALKKSLDEQYEQLRKAREELTVQRDQLNTQAQVQAFNQAAEALNQRIKAYEKERAVYLKRLKDAGKKL